MRASDYLGKPVSLLLTAAPFNSWAAERSIEDDLEEPIIHYVFKGHAVALRCDRDDIVRVIFLRADKYNKENGDLFKIPFNWSRQQVLAQFGYPEKSGPRIVDPVLGEYGEWDRFVCDGYKIHIEYILSLEEIKRTTFMCNSVSP